MKVKIPKSYKQLSHTDQHELKKFTQDVALEAAEIFPKGGFPQKFIDDLLGEVDVEVK